MQHQVEYVKTKNSSLCKQDFFVKKLAEFLDENYDLEQHNYMLHAKTNDKDLSKKPYLKMQDDYKLVLHVPVQDINNKANVSDVTSLTNTVNTKADQSTVDTLTTTVNSKANQSDLNNTNNRVTAIETGYMKKPTVISKADYDKLPTKDPNTLYEITE